jgi:hypothetical protein
VVDSFTLPRIAKSKRDEDIERSLCSASSCVSSRYGGNGGQLRRADCCSYSLEPTISQCEASTDHARQLSSSCRTLSPSFMSRCEDAS